MKFGIGQPVRRREDRRLLRGKGQFVGDFGRLINPELVAGRVHGGVVRGIGQVMGEAAAR